MNNLIDLKNSKRMFQVTNKVEEKKSEILIYDFIGKDWYGDGVDAKDISEELKNIPENTKTIEVRINSVGGSVFEGWAIYNRLIQFQNAEIHVYIDGLAASIASIIALAGNKVYMAETSMFMIHKPMAPSFGNAFEHEKTIDLLDQLEGKLLNVYKKRTGLDNVTLQNYIDKETWFDAEQCLDLGFVDEVVELPSIAKASACAISKDMFSNISNERSWIRNKPTINEDLSFVDNKLDELGDEIDDYIARF